MVVLAITTVPTDVSCIEVTVTSAQVTKQQFDVTPGASAMISLQGLPSGVASIDERTFAVPCAQVTATTPPTWVAEMPVSVTLVPGAVVDVTIVLRRAGQVNIVNDFQNGTATSFSLSPASLVFGNVSVGSQLTQSVTVTNTGAAPSLVPTPTILPDPTLPAPQFAVLAGAAANPCTPTMQLAAGATCVVQVSFAPTTPGPKTSTLVLGAATTGVSLSGTGVAAAPMVAISPSPVMFGNVNVGATALQTVMVVNTGTAPAVLSPATVSVSPPDATAQFTVQPGGASSCATMPQLLPGTTCSLTIVFAPTSAGTKTATLQLGSAASTTLSGNAVATAPMLVFMPPSLSFGNVNVGASAIQTLTVANSGTAPAPLMLPAVTVTPPDTTAQFVAQGGTCVTIPQLLPGQSCTVTVAFSPTTAGTKSATLLLGPTAAVPLAGNAVATSPTFSVTPATLAFGTLAVGTTTGALMTVTIRNPGTATITTPARTLAGADASQFVIPTGTTGGTCSTTASLAANATCTVALRFQPTTAGVKSATLNVGTAPMLATVALSGTGM